MLVRVLLTDALQLESSSWELRCFRAAELGAPFCAGSFSAFALPSTLGAPLLTCSVSHGIPLSFVHLARNSEMSQDWTVSSLVAGPEPKVIVEQAKVADLCQLALLPKLAAWGNKKANAVVIVLWAQEALRLVSASVFHLLKGFAEWRYAMRFMLRGRLVEVHSNNINTQRTCPFK